MRRLTPIVVEPTGSETGSGCPGAVAAEARTRRSARPVSVIWSDASVLAAAA